MAISFYPDNDSYTVGEITQAMLHLGFDGDQIENLINRLREENGNPDERTADERYVNTLVSTPIITCSEE